MSMVAGGLAFEMLGVVVAAATGNISVVRKTATLAGSVGMWVGAGMSI